MPSRRWRREGGSEYKVEKQAQAGWLSLGGQVAPGHFAAVLGPSQNPYGGILVNAAFLLVTTAWLTGQAPSADTKAAPAPAVQACGSSCCDDGFCHRLRERLRGMFQRDCCEPAPKCHPVRCQPAPKCQPACKPAPRCCATPCSTTTCRRDWFQHRGCCETKPACPKTDCCNDGLLSRLRALCNRRTCDCCSSSGKVGEPIPAGKKMPSATYFEEVPTGRPEVRIITPAPAPTTAPGLEAAPAVVPSIDPVDNKNPF